MSAVGVSITNVDIAAAIITERVDAGKTARRWTTVEGSGTSAALVGITGVTGSLAATALSLNLAATDGSLVDYAAGKTQLTVQTGAGSGTGGTLLADGSKGQIIRVSGTAAFAVEGALSVAGSVGISLEGSNVIVVGSGIAAQFGSADAQTHFSVTGATFGLLATGTETAFELSQGMLSASLAGFASVRAASVVAQYTSAETAIAATRKLDTGTASYTFRNAIAKDTILFAVDDFQASIADFVSFSGSIGFKSVGTGFVAVGSGIQATLDGGEVASLSIADGAFGLRVSGGETALELSGRQFSFGIGGLPAAKADTVFFRYTSAGATVAKRETLSITKDVAYTFAEPIAPDTIAFSFTGFEAAISDGLSLSGSLGFARVGNDLVAVGSDVNASLTAGGFASIAATNGACGLVVTRAGLAFELQGGFSASIDGLANISADRTVVQFASSGLAIAAGRRLGIGAASYTFTRDIPANTVAFSVEGLKADATGFVPITGSVGFAVIGGDLVAVGADMTAGFMGEQGGILDEHARFGLVASSAGTAIELGAGVLRIQIAGLTEVRSGSTYAQFATAGMAIASNRSIAAGGLGYTFATGILPGASGFAVTGFHATVRDFVSLAGDVGFSVIGGRIVAVAENVAATLAAGNLASLTVSGRLGMRVNDDQVALELTGSNLSANVANLAHVRADHVFVQYTSPTTAVTKDETLRVGQASYTFAKAISAGTVAFDVAGISADLFGVVTISGDIGFAYKPEETLIAAYATDFSAAFRLGDQIEASVNHATLDIRLGSQMLFDLQGDMHLKAFDLIDETLRVRVSPDYRRLTLDDGSQVDGAVLSFAAALPDLFFGIDGVGLTLNEATFGFAVATDLGSNRFWVAAKAEAAVAGFVGIDAFTANVADAAVVINTTTVIGNDGRSVDWSKTPYTLTPMLLGDAAGGRPDSSPAVPITLDMKGQTLAASGHATIKLLGIADVVGHFSFESSRRDITLISGAKVDVDALTIGIQHAHAFIGTTSDTGGREGLSATDVNLAFGVFTERSPVAGASHRQWSLLDASVGRFELTGIDGVSLSAVNVAMGYIHLPDATPGMAIDMSTPIAYDSSLEFSLGAERLRPGSTSLFTFAGDFDVNIRGLVQFHQDLQVEVELDTLKVFDPVTKQRTDEEVATISFAALNQDVFAGDVSHGERAGLQLTGVDIAAVIAFGPQTGSVWVAVEASATSARFVGLDGVALSTQSVDLRINLPDHRGDVIDFRAQPLEVPTGLAIRAGGVGGSVWSDGQSATIALDGTVGAEAVLDVSESLINVASFLHVRGDFSFRIGAHSEGLLVRGLDSGGGATRLDDRFAVLSLAATNVDVFVGYTGAGPTPFAGDGVAADAVGLFARDIDFGYAVFTDGLYLFDALKLDLPEASLVGLGEKVTATLRDVEVRRNAGLRLLDLRPAAVDFPATFGPAGYALATSGGTVTLDLSGAAQIAAAVADARLVVDGFLSLEGSLAFSAGGQTFGARADAGLLKAIPGVSVTGLTHDLFTIQVGGTGLRGFAGVTVAGPEGAAPRRIGVAIEDVSFGLAIMAATSISGITIPGVAGILPVYIAAKAAVGRASIVGADDIITATADDVTIEINTSYSTAIGAAFASVGLPGLYEASMAVLPMPSLDLQGTAFGGTGLAIATGDPAHPILLDFRQEVIAAEVGSFEGDLAGFVQVAGAMAFAKRGGEKVTLTSGREISVTSLGISMSDVRAFIGTGRYWGRNPTTGRIDGSVTDPTAAGFVVDSLDLGGVFMLNTSPLEPGVYAAAHVGMQSVRMTGVTGFTAEVRALSLDLNTAASLDLRAVDFSRSTHAVRSESGTITLQPGYAIAGPQQAMPVVISFDRALLQTQGLADFNLLNVAVMEGRFDLRADSAGVLVYVDGTGRLGSPDGFRIEVGQFQAFLLVNARGVAAKATLDVDPIVLGTAFSLTTDTLNLAINTTGKDVRYTIPEAIRRAGQPDSISVSAIPPGGTAAAGYVAASGGGQLKLLDAVSLLGSFQILLKADVSTLLFDMTVDMPVLNPVRVAGALEYVSGTSGGLFGSLGVGGAYGASIINVAGFSLNASMLLEVNTSPIERPVRSMQRRGESDPDGDGYVLRSVPARTARLSGNGQIAAGGVVLNGVVEMVADAGRFRLWVATEADIGFGSVNVTGEAWVLYGDGRDTALVLDARIVGQAGRMAAIDGSVTINTGSVDFVTSSATTVKAKTAFDARFSSSIDVGLCNLAVAGRMFKQGDLFEFRVDRGTADFFGVATLDVSGFYRSNGAYLFTAAGSTAFTLLDVTVTTHLALSLGRDAAGTNTFKGEVLGTTAYDWGWLGKGDGPSFRAYAAFGPTTVSFAIRVSILGIVIPIEQTWKSKGNAGAERPDPVLARLKGGGVLVLSAGDAPERYGDAGGAWYGSILNESFQIDPARDKDGKLVPGSVVVRSLGIEQTFTGVTTIVANGGEGNDFFGIGTGVDAVLQLRGGPGSDTFLAGDPVAGSLFDGGGGIGFDSWKVSGPYAQFTLINDGQGGSIAPVANTASRSTFAGMETLNFDDRTISSTAAPIDTRALAGPIVNGDVHLDLRTYVDGQLVANCDLRPDNSEPNTATGSRGNFEFPDALLATADRDGNGIVDFRDGLVVVGTSSDNGIGTTTSVIDSITGSDLGFPLVGLPGHDVSLLTTLKYATLLRWRPDQTIAGLPVTPELINLVMPLIFANTPSTFSNDDFDPYVALASSDPAEVARGVDNIRFSYSRLADVLTVIELFRQFGLDFTSEAAWGYVPDPTRADQPEIVAFSAYSYAVATRFGEHPLDSLGRPAVAAQYDATNPIHVRAMLKEVLCAYPTQRLFDLEPAIVADFVAKPTAEQQSRVDAAIEKHFATFLDNVADGLVLAQKALIRRVVDSADLSALVPAVGTQLLVPSVAGLKRLFIDMLASDLIEQAAKSPAEYRAAFYPVFYQPKPVDNAAVAATGLIGLTAPGGGGSEVTLTPDSDGLIKITLDFADERGPLAAPDYGLAVRYRLGGTAREGIDYTIVGDGGIPIATIYPGESVGVVLVRVAPEALAAGDRFIQIELLSADSGVRVDGTRAVVTIALGGRGLPGTAPTGLRATFVPHELVTSGGVDPAVLRAPAGGSNVVLRGVNGRADLFVVGDTQSAGIPFIENFHAADGDQIWIAAGDLITHRRDNQLSAAANRIAALESLRTEYGVETVQRLSPGALDALVAAWISAASPLAAFEITQLNTYGGFIFDVSGRQAVAMVSDYSAATGDSAWSSLSMNPAGGTAIATEVRLSGTNVVERAPVGTVVGTLTTLGGRGTGPYAYTLVPGVVDNALFAIVDDRLVTVQPLDYALQASYQIRVRSVGADGIPFDGSFLIVIADLGDAPRDLHLTGDSVAENRPAATVVGSLAITDADLGDSITYTLIGGEGSADNASFGISGDQLVTAAVLDREWLATRSVRIRATDSQGLWVERVFAIRVLDAADTSISVLLSGTSVAENRPVGTRVGVLSAPGAGKGMAYALVAGEGAAGNEAFVVRGNQLVTATLIDFERTPAFSVRVRATDRTGVFSERVFTITVRNAKEAPTAAVPASFGAVEDTAAKLVFSGTPFTVDAATPSLRITVTLGVEKGSIQAASGNGVTVAGTAMSRTFTGSLAALNTFFTDGSGRITFVPAKDDCGSRVLSVTIREWFRGGSLSSTARSTIVITAVDDAPQLRLPDRFQVVEDVRTPLVWRMFSVRDVDSPSLTVALEVDRGSIDVVGGRGVSVGGNTARRTLTGSAAALATCFAEFGRVAYTTEADGTTPRILSVTLSDGTTSLHGEVRIDVRPVEDRPVVAASGVLAASPSVGREIGHAELLAAAGARDVDGDPIQFVVDRVAGGTLEVWSGQRWTPVVTSQPNVWALHRLSRATIIGADTRLRWQPDSKSDASASISLRAWDGRLSSAATSRLAFGSE